MTGGWAVYRATESTLGEVRAAYAPRAGALWLVYALLAAFGALLGVLVAQEIGSLGAAAAIRADLARLGGSELLGTLLVGGMLVAILIVMSLLARRIRRIHRLQRLRFHELGLELTGLDGVAQQCRYDEIAEVTRVELGRGQSALRIERAGGSPWVISPMFEIGAIAGRLAVARRAGRLR